MKYWAVFVLFVLTFHSGWAQSTFNKLIDLGYAYQSFSSVEVDSNYIYCIGTIIDTNQISQDGIFVKYTYSGGVVKTKEFKQNNRDYSFMNPNLRWSHNSLKFGDFYFSNNDLYGFIFSLDQDGNFVDSSTINKIDTVPYNFNRVGSWTNLNNNVDILIGSYFQKKPTKSQLVLVKRANNVITNEVIVNNPYNILNTSMLRINDNKYALGNRILGTTIGDNINRSNITIIDSSMNIVDTWESNPDSTWLGASDLLNSPDGGIIVAFQRGFIDKPKKTILYKASILKIDSNYNNVLWIQDIPNTAFSKLNSVNNLETGFDNLSFFACGTTVNLDTNLGISYEGFLTKHSYSGEIIWSRKYSIIDSEFDIHTLYDMRKTVDGGIVMVGQVADLTGDILDPRDQSWIIKVDSFGCLVPGCQNTTRIDESAPVSLDIRLYPNPVTDRQVSMYVGEENPIGEMNLTLVNLQGSVVKTWKIDFQGPTTYMFEILGVLPGMYQLLVQAGKRVSTEKLVVQ